MNGGAVAAVASGAHGDVEAADLSGRCLGGGREDRPAGGAGGHRSDGVGGWWKKAIGKPSELRGREWEDNVWWIYVDI